MGTYLHIFPAQQGIRKYIPTKNYKYVCMYLDLRYCDMPIGNMSQLTI